jgi:hypothetical protein
MALGLASDFTLWYTQRNDAIIWDYGWQAYIGAFKFPTCHADDAGVGASDRSDVSPGLRIHGGEGLRRKDG